ncbi:hypothetical protein LINGRAHAP2_LOCUS26407 [Linum grandiflorum]
MPFESPEVTVSEIVSYLFRSFVVLFPNL